jgi:hypothetical protein
VTVQSCAQGYLEADAASARSARWESPGGSRTPLLYARFLTYLEVTIGSTSARA